MRQIEKKMVEAIHQRKNFHRDNTSVEQDHDWAVATVKLFGNPIVRASYMKDEHGKETILFQPYVDVIREWPTPTTVSRLTALGIRAYRRKDQVFINGHPV